MQSNQPKEHKPKFKTEVIDFNFLMITMMDENDYIINIDIIPIDAIVRVSYNAVHGQLIAIVSEAAGNIEDELVYNTDRAGKLIPVLDNNGQPMLDEQQKPINEVRFATKGSIQGFRIMINEPAAIKDLLKGLMNIKEEVRFNKVFMGFEANQIAEIKKKAFIAEMEKKRTEQSPTDQPMAPVVNLQGQPIKSD